MEEVYKVVKNIDNLLYSVCAKGEFCLCYHREREMQSERPFFVFKEKARADEFAIAHVVPYKAAEVWRCEAEELVDAPKIIPPANRPEIMESWWNGIPLEKDRQFASAPGSYWAKSLRLIERVQIDEPKG